MSDEFGNTTPPAGEPVPEQPWTQTPSTQTSYTAPPPPPAYTQAPPPPGYVTPHVAGQGLSDTSAGALAYITFIPALVFLLIEPYKSKPFVKFHAIQELGLTLVAILLHFILIIPILGLLVYIVGWIALLVVWLICILKASQGGVFKIPFLSEFAAQQSGYVI